MSKTVTTLDKYLGVHRSLKADERTAAKAKHDAGQERFDKLKRVLVDSDLPECIDIETHSPEFPEDPLDRASYGFFRLTIHGSTSMYLHVYAFDNNYEVSVGWNSNGSSGQKIPFDDVLKKLAEFIADNEPPQS